MTDGYNCCNMSQVRDPERRASGVEIGVMKGGAEGGAEMRGRTSNSQERLQHGLNRSKRVSVLI